MLQTNTTEAHMPEKLSLDRIIIALCSLLVIFDSDFVVLLAGADLACRFLLFPSGPSDPIAQHSVLVFYLPHALQSVDTVLVCVHHPQIDPL